MSLKRRRMEGGRGSEKRSVKLRDVFTPTGAETQMCVTIELERTWKRKKVHQSDQEIRNSLEFVRPIGTVQQLRLFKENISAPTPGRSLPPPIMLVSVILARISACISGMTGLTLRYGRHWPLEQQSIQYPAMRINPIRISRPPAKGLSRIIPELFFLIPFSHHTSAP